MTIKNAIGKFRDYLILEKSLSPNSVSAYLNDIDELANFCIKKHQVKIPEEITWEILMAYFNLMKNAGIDERKQKRSLAGFRSFFDFLVNNGITKNNPAQLFSLTSIPKLTNIITNEEYDAMLNATIKCRPDGIMDRAIIVLLHSCGLRVTELINLKISDINFKTNSITIVSKKNSVRVIPISKNTKDEIKEYLKTYRNYFDFQQETKNNLFLNKQANFLHRELVYTTIKRIASLADIKKNISAQIFRYTFAHQLLNSGKDIVTVMYLMGLDSVRSVEKFMTPK